MIYFYLNLNLVIKAVYLGMLKIDQNWSSIASEVNRSD